MPRVSLNSPDLELDPGDPPGFRSAMWRFGESPGAERVGTTLYEIPPGDPGEYGRLYRLGTELDYYDDESNQR
jgi:hypothetical protein